MKIDDQSDAEDPHVGDAALYHGIPVRVKEVLPDKRVVITYYAPGAYAPTQERIVPRTDLLLMRPALR